MMYLFNDILIIAKSKWTDNSNGNETIGQKIVTNLRTRAKTMLKHDLKDGTDNDNIDSPNYVEPDIEREIMSTTTNKKYKFERMIQLSQIKTVDIKHKLDEKISAAPGKCLMELLITPQGESTESLILAFKDETLKNDWINSIRGEVVSQKKRTGHFSIAFVESVKEHERGKLENELSGGSVAEIRKSSSDLFHFPPTSPKKSIGSSSPPS